jgi:hypothetical protein
MERNRFTDVTFLLAKAPISVSSSCRWALERALHLKIAVFWAVITMMTEAVSTTRMSNICQTAVCNIPEDIHFHTDIVRAWNLI